MIKDTFMMAYPSFDESKIVTIGWLQIIDIDLTDVAMLIKSTTGINHQIIHAIQHLPQAGVILVMPLGSNSSIQLNNLTDFPTAVIATGATADGITNSTGYGTGLEFISQDESLTDTSEQSSFSNGFIGGQLMKIVHGLNEPHTWVQVRALARQTASYADNYTELNGFGVIDVDAAIALGNSNPV